MREIVLDVTRLLGRLMRGRLPTGVDRVSLEYVRHFAESAVAVVRYGGRWIELSPANSARLFAELLAPSPRFNRVITGVVCKSYFGSYRRQPRGQRFFFNTDHSGLDQPGYSSRLQQFGARPLFFVHDLIPITHPEYCRPGEGEKHAVRMATVLRLGHGIIANSEATLTDLRGFAEQAGQVLPPSVVAMLAPASLNASVVAPPVTGPYFVMLSTIEPRKNHWLLLHVWRRLVEQMGEQAPKLIVIGQRGWECENVEDMLERCEALRGFVMERPGCSDAELATYLRHARALLFPSFAEGYGLPLAEALSLGVPAIASDLAAFREIAGDIPDYLDPLDGPAWMAKIAEYSAADSQLRTMQLQRLAHFKVPSWVDHFEAVEELLDCLRQG